MDLADEAYSLEQSFDVMNTITGSSLLTRRRTLFERQPINLALTTSQAVCPTQEPLMIEKKLSLFSDSKIAKKQSD